MANLLLGARADVNETTTVTTTFASLLLLLNALVDGQAGKTPLDFAHHLKDAAMIRMLESYNEVSNIETPYRKPVA